MRYCLIVCYITIAIILKNMSVAHPYLLADNRHYTFYIWRRFLSIKQPVEVLIFPILYIYCGCAMFFSLKQRDNLWKCLFFASAAMALIPQSLLEFRYFLIPFMIWRLNSTTTSVKQYVMELAFNAALDLLTIYIFMYKKFRWDGHDGHQRFMWWNKCLLLKWTLVCVEPGSRVHVVEHEVHDCISCWQTVQRYCW